MHSKEQNDDKQSRLPEHDKKEILGFFKLKKDTYNTQDKEEER